MKKGEKVFYKSAESRKRALLNYIYFNPDIIINDDYSDSVDIYYNNVEVHINIAEKIIEEANKACSKCKEWNCEECEYRF